MPDFRQFYGLSLVDAARSLPPAEMRLLIEGLPERSRFMARLAGEPVGEGWSRADWLLLDLRNVVEGLRVAVVGALSKKAPKFQQFEAYPGRVAQRRAEQRRRFDRLFQQASRIDEEESWPDLEAQRSDA